MTTAPATDVPDRLVKLRERIDSVADGRNVRIVAVTKGFDSSAITTALALGLTDVGENYAQEAKAKHDELGDIAGSWHFIGQLQRNKVRLLAPFVTLWQSVDNEALATEIAKRAPGAAVLLQVDLAKTPGRGGCSFEELPRLLQHASAAGLQVRGLMGVAPAGDADATRRAFTELAAARADLGLAELSIGMSGDIEIAVECGATMVRAGSALFGARQYPAR